MKFSQTGKAKSAKFEWAKQKVLCVTDFITDSDDKAIGVKGLSYPDRKNIEVLLDNDCPQAANPKRKTFEDCRNGYTAIGQKRKMEIGAILRLNCTPDSGTDKYKTTWINMLAGNEELAKSTMRFGFMAVELFPASEEIAEKFKEFKKQLQNEKPGIRGYEIENAFLEEIKGQQRYHGHCLQYHDQNIFTADANGLRAKLVEYYASPKFASATTEAGKEYEPINPGLIIRAINSDGHVVSAVDITSAKLFHAEAKTPEARADFAADSAQKMFGDDIVSFNILPYDKTSISQIALTVEDATILNIKALTRARNASFEIVEGTGGNDYENRANQAAVRTAGNGMVVEVVIPDGAARVDVALLDKDGSLMVDASKVEKQIEEQAADEESASPGM
jgi:hypothetical protein